MPRPKTVESIYIEASPEDVFNFALYDLESLPDWMSSVESIESAEPNWPALGSSHTYSRTVQKNTVVGRTTVIELNPPSLVVMREDYLDEDGKPRRGEDESKHGRTVWRFAPEKTGTRATFELTGAELSQIWYIAWRLFFSGRIKTNTKTSLYRLKKICEEELENIPADERKARARPEHQAARQPETRTDDQTPASEPPASSNNSASDKPTEPRPVHFQKPRLKAQPARPRGEQRHKKTRGDRK